MRVFAIADPHLSRVHPKPMTIFGPAWQGHPEAFFRGWREVVGPEDLVIVAGDISWAMRLAEAIPDLLDLASLPGRKVLLKGNHDYWWPSISRLRAVLPEGMYALQNDALVLDGVAVAGTRGWEYPPKTPEDEKIFAREVERLGLSLKALKGQPYRHLVLAFHFPPFGPGGLDLRGLHLRR
jgi:predicted phosphohydrolase